MRLKSLMVLVASVGTFLVAPSVTAKDGQPKRAAKNVREMDFEGDVVEAQFLRPDQAIINTLGPGRRSTLIKIRTDFLDEILKSAEDM